MILYECRKTAERARKTAAELLSRDDSVRARLLIAYQYTELLVMSLSYPRVVVTTPFNSGRVLDSCRPDWKKLNTLSRKQKMS